MSDILFDKLIFVDRLKGDGFTDKQARTLADALDEALRESVATKGDVVRLNGKVHLAAERASDELKHLKGLLLIVIGLNVLMLFKDLF